MYKVEGIKGLFKGVTHSITWSSIYYGVQFFAYDTVKEIIVKESIEKSQRAG